MLQGQVLKCLILFMTIFKCVYNFEVFLSKTNNNNDQNIENLGSYRNKTYEVPLFETRYITIRTHFNDFRHNKNNDSNVVGFKFQVRSTDPNVVNIRKEAIPTKTDEINNFNTVLIEDLYICEY